MNFLYYRMNSLMFKTKILILVFFFISIHIDLLHSQSHFLGRIVDDANQFIPYAKVSWLGTNGQEVTDVKGVFSISYPPDTSMLPYVIVVSYLDLLDTFEFDDLHSFWTFHLNANVTLQEVTIYDNKIGAYVSSLQPIKTEVINRNELRKAACCDLAGCFETQSSVQPQTTNILTNTKELRILGLSGVYNQVLVDGIPTILGLTYTYGISTIPGSIVENIWVVKGANSVLQGYENMVGQITIFPREGGTAEPFTADLLINSFGEKHVNVGVSISNNNWTNYLAIHSSQPANKIDKDDNGFLDLPLLTRYSIYNKWRFRKENENGFSTFVGFRLVDEKRIGGQLFYDPELDRGSTKAYGLITQFLQTDIYTKSGYRFNENKKIVLHLSSIIHNQQSWFGLVRYQPKQIHQYANLQYEYFYGSNKRQDLKVGTSFRYIDAKEIISFSSDTIDRSYNGVYIKKEIIPGVFIENIFNSKKSKFTAITGIRMDHLNQRTWYLTPRILLKYTPDNKTDIRASIGTGWRTVSLFAENINVLTSNRNLVFKETLNPEKSVNLGLSVNQKWKIGKFEFLGSVDFYHTQFQNQFFPDYDTKPDVVTIANFTGTSISNAFQSEISSELNDMLSFRIAYNALDVYRKIEDQKFVLPFNSKHRFLFVLSFKSKLPLWQVDLNVHTYGRQRLPESKSLPFEFQQMEYSDPFSIASIQYTHSFKNMEGFVGCENIFDFRQQHPIIDPQRPFGKYFDTSFAWGPTRGRELYVGLRFKILK